MRNLSCENELYLHENKRHTSVSDPDLQIRGEEGGRSQKKIFRPSVWSKNKGPGPSFRSATALSLVLKQRLKATLKWNIVRDKDNSFLQR